MNFWVKLLLLRVFNCIHRKFQRSPSFVLLTKSMSVSIPPHYYNFPAKFKPQEIELSIKYMTVIYIITSERKWAFGSFRKNLQFQAVLKNLRHSSLMYQATNTQLIPNLVPLKKEAIIYREMLCRECLANCFPCSSPTSRFSLVQRARNHLYLLDVAVLLNGSNSSCNLQTGMYYQNSHAFWVRKSQVTFRLK